MRSAIPTKLKVLAGAAAGLMGPATVFALLLGGPPVGIGVLLAFIFFFIILYLYIVRRHG